jgi:hypothetical protein
VAVLSNLAALSGQPSDIYATFGTNAEVAANSIIGSFTSGTIALIGERTIFTTASPEQRALLVRGAIAAARAYTQTADFTARYTRFRDGLHPTREVVPQNGGEAMAAQQKQLEEVIKQAQKMASELPAEARQQLADNIDDMKRQLAELNADPQHRASVDAAAKEAAREAETNYVLRSAEFDKEYPADPKQLVAGRLRTFLDLSTTVDFDAKVERLSDKRMHFVNPEYELKPREWKLMYRAGKPAVDAARTAAQEWLKALER